MVRSLIFTLLVATGEGDEATTQAILRALGEALGPSAIVAAREVDGPLTDEAALAVEGRTGSAAVAIVSWIGQAHLEARVRVHLRDGDRWVARGVTFLASDDRRERGRTLGFTLASMVPDVRAPEAPPPTPRPPPPLVVTARTEPPAPSKLAIDLSAAGSMGVSGNADAVGGALALRRALVPWLAVRFELSGRTGADESAAATLLSVHAGVGLCWNPLGNPAANRADVALRADVGAFYESLSHLSPDDADRVRRARVLPGGDLVLETSLRVFDTAAIVLGLGAEMAFGRTDVYVRETRVSVIPPLRLVSTLGLRHYF